MVLSLYFFGTVLSLHLRNDFRPKLSELLGKETQGWVELLERVGFDVLYRMVNETRLPPQLSVSIYPPPQPDLTIPIHTRTHTHTHTHTHRVETKERTTKQKNTQHKKGDKKKLFFLTCRHPKQNDASMEFQITFSVSTNVQKRGWALREVWGCIL